MSELSSQSTTNASFQALQNMRSETPKWQEKNRFRFRHNLLSRHVRGGRAHPCKTKFSAVQSSYCALICYHPPPFIHKNGEANNPDIRVTLQQYTTSLPGRLDSRVVFTLNFEHRNATPWAVSSSLGDVKLFFGPKHNIYALFVILFDLFDSILLFVCQICHVNCEAEN